MNGIEAFAPYAARSRAIRRGRRVVDIIDTIVRDAFRDDAKVLAKRRSAKRVRALPGGAGSAESGATRDAAPAPQLPLVAEPRHSLMASGA